MQDLIAIIKGDLIKPDTYKRNSVCADINFPHTNDPKMGAASGTLRWVWAIMQGVTHCALEGGGIVSEEFITGRVQFNVNVDVYGRSRGARRDNPPIVTAHGLIRR